MLYAARQHIPDTISEFYSELFDVLFYRHDRTKSGFVRKRHVDVGDHKIRRIFEGICFFSVLKGYRTFRANQFAFCVVESCKLALVDLDVRKLQDELVKTACLLKEEGQELAFIHKSVQEFYSASFVARSSDSFAEQFYTSMRGEARRAEWRQQLNFLTEIDDWRYANYYWIPTVENISKGVGLAPEKFFSSKYVLSFDVATRLIRGTRVDYMVDPSATRPSPEAGELGNTLSWFDWVGLDQGLLRGPQEILGDLFEAACPLLHAGDWISRQRHEVMQSRAAAIQAFALTLAVPEQHQGALVRGAAVEADFDGLVAQVSRNGDFSFSVSVDLADLLDHSAAFESVIPYMQHEIENMSVKYKQYKKLVEAESQKSALISLMKNI